MKKVRTKKNFFFENAISFWSRKINALASLSMRAGLFARTSSCVSRAWYGLPFLHGAPFRNVSICRASAGTELASGYTVQKEKNVIIFAIRLSYSSVNGKLFTRFPDLGAISFFSPFESCYVSVLCPILLKLHILACLLESFPFNSDTEDTELW